MNGMNILNIICSVMTHFHHAVDGVVKRDVAHSQRFGNLEGRVGESSLAASFRKSIGVQYTKLLQ